MNNRSTDNIDIPSKPTIDIVIPLLNEAGNIQELVTQLTTILEPPGSYKILFVDDGSTDSSIAVLKEVSNRNPHVKYISLTRNFGHQIALKTGLLHSNSDAAISMDADLQHPPCEIPRMITAWQEGFKVVNMVRREKTSSIFKRTTSYFYYKLVNLISDFEIVPGSSDFRLLDKSVVELIQLMPEKCIFLRGLIPWFGFNQIDLPYELPERKYGKSKFRLFKMIQLATTGITSSSIRPLRIAFFIGAITSSTATLYALYALAIKIFYDTAISGWASLLIGMMLLGGVQLLMLGVIGEYVGRVFIEVKGRPDSIIASSNID